MNILSIFDRCTYCFKLLFKILWIFCSYPYNCGWWYHSGWMCGCNRSRSGLHKKACIISKQLILYYKHTAFYLHNTVSYIIKFSVKIMMFSVFG